MPAVVAYKNGMRLADMLRARIDELGISDRAAADTMGVDPVNVSRWLSSTVPKPEQHPALRQFLEVDDGTLARLLHDQKIRPPTIEQLAAEIAVMKSEIGEISAALRGLTQRGDQ